MPAISSETVAKHYDELDSLYRQVWGTQLHHGLWDKDNLSQGEAVLRMTDYLADLGGLVKGSRLLDVGCGYGSTANYLSEKFDLSVLGVSVSHQQIAFATANSSHPKVEFKECDFLQCSLEQESFDYIWASECLSHMPSAEEFFKKCFHLLRPGGQLIIAAWLSGENPSGWEQKHLLNPICNEGSLFRLLSTSKCLKLMKAEGFEIKHQEDLSSKVQKTWFVIGQKILRHFKNNPKDLAMLLPHNNSNARFALSLLRIPIAYRTGAMRYGVVVAEKP